MANQTPPLITIPFASQGDQSVIPSTDPNGFVNYTTGYTPDYEINLAAGDPAAKAVERGIQNYLFWALTTGMQSWQTAARPPWYSAMPGGYAKYAEVVVPDSGGNSVPYRSKISGNISAPGPSATNWEYIESTSEMIANVPMPSGGPSGPGSMLVSSATDFNTFTNSGSFNFSTDAVVLGSPHTPSNGGQQAGAGLLEVMIWSDGGSNTFISQFFRDRNGLGFMRGATNGSWTAWKIWANAHQFVVGEVRMWSGTATEAAVQSAWGPGWHLCNGLNGTPNLQDKFIVGAGNTYALGATGGSTTASLVTANLPAHNHSVTITDPGHVHGMTQSAHAHGISDAGHAHGVYDPGHIHSLTVPTALNQGTTSSNGAEWTFANAGTASVNVNAAGTGIGIYANGTGIAILGATIPISVNSAATGITATTANTGSGSSFGILPPYYALCYVMYTGA